VVGYRGGGPALVDLLSGQVQVMFEGITSSIGYIKAGKLRALGVSTKERLKVLPDVPALAEFLPGYEATGWLGIGAPAGTPQNVIDIVNRAVNAGLKDPKLVDRMAALGAVPAPMTPAEFKQFIAAETAKWGEVVKFAGIKAE
jgi:tripartite-type tricarboxylate transporter receptor subunit TctC